MRTVKSDMTVTNLRVTEYGEYLSDTPLTVFEKPPPPLLHRMLDIRNV